MYLFIERERERSLSLSIYIYIERERDSCVYVYVCIYIYIYIYGQRHMPRLVQQGVATRGLAKHLHGVARTSITSTWDALRFPIDRRSSCVL